MSDCMSGFFLFNIMFVRINPDDVCSSSLFFNCCLGFQYINIQCLIHPFYWWWYWAVSTFWWLWIMALWTHLYMLCGDTQMILLDIHIYIYTHTKAHISNIQKIRLYLNKIGGGIWGKFYLALSFLQWKQNLEVGIP